MGLQVRKRSKGSRSWFNGSYSKSRGVGTSGSVKVADNVTYNTGNLLKPDSKSRITVNLGEGFRWVFYGKSKKAKSKQNSSSPNYVQHPKSFFGSIVYSLFALCILVLAVIGSVLGGFELLFLANHLGLTTDIAHIVLLVIAIPSLFVMIRKTLFNVLNGVFSPKREHEEIETLSEVFGEKK